MGTITSEALVNQILERSYCRNSEYRSVSHQILSIKLGVNMKSKVTLSWCQLSTRGSLKNPQYGQFRREVFFTSWGGVQSVISKVKVCINQGYLEFLVCKVGACQFFCLLLRLGLHFLEVQSQHMKYLDRRNHCTLA